MNVLEARPSVAVPKKDAAPARPVKAKKALGPNKTEMVYKQKYLDDSAMYEGVTLHLKNGHRYTPDWVIFNDGGLGYGLECVEVKGAYKFHSEGRAKLAFDQAKVDFPHIRFRWAVLQKNGTWKIT